MRKSYKFYISLFQSKSRAEKSELDQKILEVIQKRSALKSQVYSPEMSSLDCNNNQELLRRAALAQELALNQTPQSSGSCLVAYNEESHHIFHSEPLFVALAKKRH